MPPSRSSSLHNCTDILDRRVPRPARSATALHRTRSIVAFAETLSLATAIVYRVRDGHLNPLELVLLGTMVELVYFASSVPTGVVADVVSRRACIIAGTALCGGGMLMQWASPTFTTVLLAQLPIGLGAALTVGAEESWLADETGEEHLTPVFLRATQAGLAGTILGAIAAGVLATHSLRLPFLIGGAILLALAATLTLIMPETMPVANRPLEHSDASGRSLRAPRVVSEIGTAFAAQITTTARSMRRVHGLWLFLAMIFLVGLWSESFDRLWNDYLLVDIHLPGTLGDAWWFALISAASALLGMAATAVAQRRTANLKPTSVVESLIAVIAVSVRAALLAGAAALVPAIACLSWAGERAGPSRR